MEPKKKPLNNIVQFSGLAFQMIGVMLAAYLLGDWIDAKIESKNHVSTIILLTLATIASVIMVIRKAIQSGE